MKICDSCGRKDRCAWSFLPLLARKIHPQRGHFLINRAIEIHRFGIAVNIDRCPAQASPWQVDLTSPYTRWSQDGVSWAQGTNSLKLLLLLLLLILLLLLLLLLLVW